MGSSRNQPDANVGYVVSHIGLNTERHWEDFCELDENDKILWASLASGQDQSTNDAGQHSETIQAVDVHVSEQMVVENEMVAQTEARYFAELDGLYTEPEKTNDPLEQDANLGPSYAGPQQRRQESKSRLQNEVNHTIRNILNKAGYSGYDRQLGRRFRFYRAQNNWSALRFWIFGDLNKRLKHKPGTEWSLSDAEQAIDILPTLEKSIIGEIGIKQSRRNQWQKSDELSNMLA